MSEPWLGRYLDAEPLGRGGAFQRVAAKRAHDGVPCVVVAASPHAHGGRAHEALARFAHAHTAIEHPSVPRAVVADEPVRSHRGRPFVELACDASFDGLGLLERLIGEGASLTYAELDALIMLLADAIRAAWRSLGVPGLSQLALGSLLVSRTGSVQFLGFGHPVAVLDEQGKPSTAQAVFAAPEVAIGATPTEASDFVAALLLRRALLPHVELPDAIARVGRGAAPESERDRAIAQAIAGLERHIHATPPARGSLDDGLEWLAAIRKNASIEPDLEGLGHLLASLAAGLPARSAWESSMPEDATEETLVVGRDGSWVESASRTRTELGPSLRRIVALLLARHREEPGRTTTTWELLDAGWPGEVVLPEAGPNRVYVAVKRIRDAGLRGVVERHEDGYRISPLARFTEIG